MDHFNNIIQGIFKYFWGHAFILKSFKWSCPFKDGTRLFPFTSFNIESEKAVREDNQQLFYAPLTTSFKDNSAKLYVLQLVMTIPGFAVAPTSGAIITEVHLENEWSENVESIIITEGEK